MVGIFLKEGKIIQDTMASKRKENELNIQWQHLTVLTFVYTAVLSFFTADSEGEHSLLSLLATFVFSFGFAVFSLLIWKNRSKYIWIFLFTCFMFLMFKIRVQALSHSQAFQLEHWTSIETENSHQNEIGQDDAVAVSTSSVTGHSDKIETFLGCLKCANPELKKKSVNYETDPEILRKHYEELNAELAPFRPTSRSKRTMYRGYTGPRLEDHFITYMIDLPYEENFAPVVPLYIHWTEVHFGRAGGGFRVLKDLLLRKLRKDVVYFTVTTDWSRGVQRALKGYNIIFASSKGDKNAHVILPHLFYYNSPGYNTDGQPIWNLDEVTNLPEPERVVSDDATWAFKNYDSFQTAPNLTVSSDMVPDHNRITFIGSLSTHAGRRKMHNLLESKYKDLYYFGFFPLSKTCKDTSVESGASFCWRTFMLSSDVNLCPVGTAPVSYRMYEALQMGAIPVYLHDYRGAFIPYAGTDADIRNGMGWAAKFEDLDSLVENEISKMSMADVSERRRKIMQYRNSHFTPKGVISQVRKFLKQPASSDLQCCSNP